MKLILFVHKEAGEKGRLLEQSMSTSFTNLSLIENTNALRHYLKDPGQVSSRGLLVLMADTRERLEELICIQDLLEDQRLVLVVPDTDPATLSRAQQLFPRFFTEVSHQYDDLCSVVNQMVHKASQAY